MASSLFEMCRRAAIKNIDEITDVGEVPYYMIAPALKQIRTPGQLVDIPLCLGI